MAESQNGTDERGIEKEAKWPSRNSIKNAIDRQSIMQHVDGDYSVDDVVDATIEYLNPDKHITRDILYDGWEKAAIHDVTQRYTTMIIGDEDGPFIDPRVPDGLGTAVTAVVSDLIEFQDEGRIKVVAGDHRRTIDGIWSQASGSDIKKRVNQYDHRMEIPNWVYRAVEIDENTDFSWKQCKVIALIESDKYAEQKQIADLMDVSPAAISDIKRRIESKIEDVEYIKDSSDYF